MHSYDEMSEPPVLTPSGLRLSVKQEKKRVLGVFGGGHNTKVVQIGSEEQARVSHVGMSTEHMHGSHSSSLHSQPQHPSRDTQHLGRSPQHFSSSRHISRGFLSSRRAPQHPEENGAPKRGLFGVVGSIGTGITKLGRDVAVGVSKAATARPLTHSGARPTMAPGNTGYSSARQGPRPVVQSTPSPQSHPVQIEWEDVVFYVQVPKEDSTMQVFVGLIKNSVWACHL